MIGRPSPSSSREILLSRAWMNLIVDPLHEAGTSADRARSPRALHQPAEVLATAGQQLAQAAGDHGQHHVVNRGAVGVSDLLGDVQATADDG